jgi:sugar-specific transcriptional regulator TrmB
MSQISDYLEALNLSAIESRLYITLLESGPISVRELAETIEMKRTTAYLYIDQLVTKGLVMKVIKGPHKLVAVVNPETSLKALVKQKSQTAQTLKKEFPEIIKQVSNIFPMSADIGDAEIKYYKGISGVRKIYEEALKAKELRSYVNLSQMEGIFPQNSDLFSDANKNNPNLKMFEIFEESEHSRKAIALQSQNKFFQYRFHPKDIEFSAADTLIYEGTVSIVNVHSNGFSGIILKNTDYYKNSKELFDFIWKILPEAK